MKDAPDTTPIQLTESGQEKGHEATSITRKKRRSPYSSACELCKTKKVKCDAASMPGTRCSECISYDRECVRPTKKNRASNSKGIPIVPGPPLPAAGNDCPPLPAAVNDCLGPSCSQAMPVEPLHLHALVEPLLNQLPAEIGSAVAPTLSQISGHIENLERQVAKLSILVQGSSSSMLNPHPSSLEAVEEEGSDEEQSDSDNGKLSESLAELHIQPGESGKHFGPSSTMVLVGMAMKVIWESRKDPDIIPDLRGIRRPAYWSILPWEAELDKELSLHEFPPPDLMMDLIEIYFKEINNILPLLHKPTFLRSLRANEHILNPQFGETVLLVCATGARWSLDPRVLLEGDDAWHSAGWRWFRQVRLFRREPYTTMPSVYALQANILSALYIDGSSQPELSWVILGLGIRYVIEVGAHRKRALPPAEAELWKRAFWIIWCYDGLWSSVTGRPRAFLADDYDVDLPIDCDDEFWETDNPEDAFKQPATKPSKLSAFISYIQLVKISEYAQTNLFSIKATKEISSGKRNAQDIVSYLDSELNRWLDSVPKHLRWENFSHVVHSDTYKALDPEAAMFFRQAMMLQGTYHHIRILAHRLFIFTSKPDSPTFTSSWAVCSHAARACFRILKFDHDQPFTTVHFMTVAAAAIVLLEKWKPGNQSSQARLSSSSREIVMECLKFFTKCEARWVGAGRLGDVLRELLRLDDLVTNPRVSATTLPASGRPETPTLGPAHTFSTPTHSFPTVDLDFLWRGFGSDNETFSMLF